MSLVLANIDANFREPYVLHGFENVGSTETMVLGRHKSQNVGFRRFLITRIVSFSTFRFSAPDVRPNARNQCFQVRKNQRLKTGFSRARRNLKKHNFVSKTNVILTILCVYVILI